MRGNGKIIQELEGDFRGAGWHVIKLLWGKGWDDLLRRDKDGKLRQLMMETLDGDYQAYKANDGKYVRDHFFGKDPELLKRVEKWSDEDIWRLRRGGHNLGGEQSGHILFLDHATTGDGILSALQVLSTMLESGRSLADLKHVMERVPQKLVNVRVKHKRPFADVPLIAAAIARAEEELADARAETLSASGGPVADAHFDGRDLAFLQRVGKRFPARPGTGVARLTGGKDGVEAFLRAAGGASAGDVRVLGTAVAEALGGRGGGSGRLFQGKGNLTSRDEALAVLRARLGA